LVLAELSEERMLMGQMGPRHGNTQEAEGGCVFISLFLILIESQVLVPNISLRVEGMEVFYFGTCLHL